MTRVAALPERAALAVAGEDRVSFLQGLVSADVTEVAPGRAVWAALLTPQGKWLADFFILSDGERLLLDCERGQVTMLAQRLSRFRLRSKVRIEPCETAVYVAWDGIPEADGGLRAPDPRLPEAGWRILSATPLATNATAEDFDLPDGSRDLEAEKTVLLEAGFDELNGISWNKGCYMGQELTARTRYRGLVKRRLIPVEVDGALPATGTPVLLEGVEVGTMRSGRDARGMALLRLQALGSGSLVCDNARLTAHAPAWMRLPEPAG
jgi:folate-binding protein YgfZ